MSWCLPCLDNDFRNTVSRWEHVKNSNPNQTSGLALNLWWEMKSKSPCKYGSTERGRSSCGQSWCRKLLLQPARPVRLNLSVRLISHVQCFLSQHNSMSQLISRKNYQPNSFYFWEEFLMTSVRSLINPICFSRAVWKVINSTSAT